MGLDEVGELIVVEKLIDRIPEGDGVGATFNPRDQPAEKLAGSIHPGQQKNGWLLIHLPTPLSG